MKRIFSIALFKVSLVFAGLTFFLVASILVAVVNYFHNSEITTQPIFIRSWESKAIHGEAVYNTVKYFKKLTQEIWMMNQSHLVCTVITVVTDFGIVRN